MLFFQVWKWTEQRYRAVAEGVFRDKRRCENKPVCPWKWASKRSYWRCGLEGWERKQGGGDLLKWDGGGQSTCGVGKTLPSRWWDPADLSNSPSEDMGAPSWWILFSINCLSSEKGWTCKARKRWAQIVLSVEEPMQDTPCPGASVAEVISCSLICLADSGEELGGMWKEELWESFCSLSSAK